MSLHDIPPYLQAQLDLQIPVPNTHPGLPLSWNHVIPVRKLLHFFGRVCREMRARGERDGVGKYRTWMLVLLEMDISVRQGDICSS